MKLVAGLLVLLFMNTCLDEYAFNFSAISANNYDFVIRRIMFLAPNKTISSKFIKDTISLIALLI